MPPPPIPPPAAMKSPIAAQKNPTMSDCWKGINEREAWLLIMDEVELVSSLIVNNMGRKINSTSSFSVDDNVLYTTIATAIGNDAKTYFRATIILKLLLSAVIRDGLMNVRHFANPE